MNRRRDEYYRDAHDERVEPHRALTPSMPSPDWASVIVQPNQKKMPVGDPTLWANTVTTTIDSDPVLGNTPRIIQGEQIILAQASDRYSRSWSLSGVVTAPIAAWNGEGPPTPPGFPDIRPAGDHTPLEVWLSVLQGIEKITLEQQILLMSGGTGFGHTYGLCNQQYSGVNGPYGSMFTSPLAEQGQESRSFAAIGSLIGNTISVRGIFVRSPTGQVPNASIALIITPYAPGAGI
jgi:hypothetical protein